MKQRILPISKQLSSGEALLITNDANRFYFTAFSSSAGMVLITPDKAYFIIDFRYYEKAKNTLDGFSVELSDNPIKTLDMLLQENAIKKLFVETSTISLSEYKRYSEKLKSVVISEDDSFQKQILKMRSSKDRDELSLIKKAQELTDKTFRYILPRIEAGRTEREVLLDMEFYMRGLGSEGVSFDFIVLSGKNTSLPHGVATDKKIEKGDFVTMDFGAVVGGYRSDMTRTVAIGALTEKQTLVYNTVLEAQNKAISALKAGVIGSKVDKAARDIISKAGFKDCFGHALGHSVGIEIHEAPTCSPRSEEKLPVGTVMTVEPGIYIENEFGVRIEDMIYVTENGGINLTKSPKNLIIL